MQSYKARISGFEEEIVGTNLAKLIRKYADMMKLLPFKQDLKIIKKNKHNHKLKDFLKEKGAILFLQLNSVGHLFLKEKTPSQQLNILENTRDRCSEFP